VLFCLLPAVGFTQSIPVPDCKILWAGRIPGAPWVLNPPGPLIVLAERAQESSRTNGATE
jgi:hypothetical protein